MKTNLPDKKIAFPAPAGEALTEKDFAFLLDEVGTLFELAPEENIYERIAVSLDKFFDSAVVLVTSFEEASNTLQVRAVSGLGTYLDKIIGLLGSHPIDVSVAMNDVAREGLGFGTLKTVDGGIYELATGSIPEMICRRIEHVLGIKSTYAMGITWRGRIMGSVVMLARDEIQNPAIVETFVDFSAVAIQHWLDEKNAKQINKGRVPLAVSKSAR